MGLSDGVSTSRGSPRLLAAALPLAVLVSSAAGQSLTRVPALGGRQPVDPSFCFGIAPDRSALFLNAPDGFVAGDANGQFDVVELDLATGVHSIVVHGLGGASPNGVTYGRNASSAAHRLLFLSTASNLVAGDTNGFNDVFVVERATGVVVRASLGNGGVQSDGPSWTGEASDDGRFVVFTSDADNLTAGSASPHTQTFLRDTVAGTTELVSATPAGAPGNHLSLDDPQVSDDGRFVVFVSVAGDLVAGDTNGLMDIFLRDRNLGTTVRLNLGPGGQQANGPVNEVRASADCARVVFEGYMTTLVPGTTGGNEVYLLDRPNNALSVISVGIGGLGVNSGGGQPRISDDGLWVAFWSDADLDPTASPPMDTETFLFDTVAGTNRVVSRSTAGNLGAPPIFTGPTMQVHSIANGGSLVTFQTNRLGLVAGDTNLDHVDVFIRDALSTCPAIESYCTGKVNSFGCRPSMTTSGEPHVGGPTDAFYLATSEFRHGQVALILWSPTATAAPFSGGTLCLAAPIVRTPPQHTGGTGNAPCTDGTLSFHFSQAYMASRGIVAGVTLFAQAYGRDNGLPPPFPTGLSNGIRFTTAP